ncbi:hypothetical protein IWX90DRAFT_95182 [Phyllosticta citrichinensis]|uniref:Uncharacterized protein n=1 Tax=Phyllosticta citrichinensis TaxID=1130410 RepID=A0ABR1XES8_9PEZI
MSSRFRYFPPNGNMNESLVSPEDSGTPVTQDRPPFRAKLRALLSFVGHAFNPAVSTFLVASLLSRSLKEGVSEITAEILCFFLLFVGIEIFGSKEEPVKKEGKWTKDDNDSYETALISLGIFTTAVCRYLADVGWVTVCMSPDNGSHADGNSIACVDPILASCSTFAANSPVKQ